MKTVIISQARMTSTRLPGKVLKEVMGKPLLTFQIERLKRVGKGNEIVVATTVHRTDDPVEELCCRLGVKCFRGPEDDVLARYYHAATDAGADVVVRVTADCPLIDPGIVDAVIASFAEGGYDYVSNTLTRTYPRGMDTEVFSYKVLAEAYKEAEKQSEREHVTPFIYTRRDRYKLGSVKGNEDNSKYRWTVDTSEDFELIKNILEYVYPHNPLFVMEDCIQAHMINPRWFEINAQVEQIRA
ncbi:cytidylyltransferase domain-containing protein [Desulfosporosinus fructosivorans]